jgi:hypothetical protein
MDMEDYFIKIASIQKKDVLIITDRGAMDNTAYCSKEVEQQIYDETKWTREGIMQRYEMVCHLVSAADGAEEFYTLENNKARSEGVDLAKFLDKIT